MGAGLRRNRGKLPCMDTKGTKKAFISNGLHFNGLPRNSLVFILETQYEKNISGWSEKPSPYQYSIYCGYNLAFVILAWGLFLTLLFLLMITVIF